MFTGLVAGVCRVEWVRSAGRGRQVAVRLGPLAEGVEPGDSIALSGVCSTVERLSGPVAVFHLGEETLARTWFTQGLTTGKFLNVERALCLGDRLDGHLVQGHVEGVGEVVGWDQGGGGKAHGEGLFSLRVPPELSRYIVAKGSIALDGVSLTVATMAENRVGVALIPTTLRETTLAAKRPGDQVNIETDILSRYVEKLLPG